MKIKDMDKDMKKNTDKDMNKGEDIEDLLNEMLKKVKAKGNDMKGVDKNTDKDI